ncbi:TetR/AcrR family transcriptional regulator [Promicromonospora sp. MEB111]|uniref:TetR/AcrR family transcriptional regulator n=1 Tax=Promicromonospora sp. MEB111 TaxID=3040301 RepID=UPI00255142F7|nr:TetR/AcrR family transcriptional regulator [Promicromonospora sp. MEB111]
MVVERTRRDAARNRDLLVAAARRVFAERGPDVPLEEIASEAGVSRTTLHRHFENREALASAVLEHNVTDIEARAAALADADDGAERLFHFLLDVQFESPWLARVVADGRMPGTADLAARTAAALDPLLDRARSLGRVHPGVGTGDVLLTLPMVMAVQAAASAAVESAAVDAAAGAPPRLGTTRAILHRGLFTTEPPTAG